MFTSLLPEAGRDLYWVIQGAGKLRKKRFHKLLGVENFEILDTLTDSDHLDGNAQLSLDSDRHSSFGGTI
jgi:hypothetical protein